MLENILVLVLLLIIVIYVYNYYKLKNSTEPFNTNQKTNNINNINNLTARESPKIIENRDNNESSNIDYGTKDYNEILANDNNDLTYYYNDVIDQTKINESAYNIVNQVDRIDYSNVKTGLEKCLEKCDGTCFELGYMGIATCFPKQTKSFDLGTLYKNPTFTYGYNAFKNKQ
jgi:hypothetical protein